MGDVVFEVGSSSSGGLVPGAWRNAETKKKTTCMENKGQPMMLREILAIGY
jgi:hypothetical protein